MSVTTSPKRVSFITLGCRLNQADSAIVADDLSRHGFDVVPYEESCEVVIVNSCSVTGVASRKTRQVVRGARRRHPQAFIVVMGCDATAAAEYYLETADLVVQNPRLQPMSEILPAVLEPTGTFPAGIIPGSKRTEGFISEGTGLFSERTRANLKVQDGCSFNCSYCIVPQTRGAARSRDFDDVLREARELLARGHRELVLTGVNVTTYRNHGADLADLMEAILGLGDGFRVRLGSAEPGIVVPKIVQLMQKTPRVCRFLHLPLQYGENTLLRAMKRHYTAEQYRELVLAAHDAVPGICFGTDVIVGFPGETDELFESCLNYIQALPFGLMHIFTYSPRPGTPAATLPGRPKACVSEKRSARLIQLAADKARQFAESQIGKTLQVLIEDKEPNTGWSDNYLHVQLTNPPKTPLNANDLVQTAVSEFIEDREVRGTLL